VQSQLKFGHRIALLVSLAAIALIVLTIVTLVLGRRGEQQLVGIETRYVPLIELDRDLNRVVAEVMKAMEDAVGAAEEAPLVDAARLRGEFLRRIAAGRDAITDNGASPDALVAAFEAYYRAARTLSEAVVRGAPLASLTAEIEAMRAERRNLLAMLGASTSPDRNRLAAAFAAARASQRESLVIEIVVACATLLVMGFLSWRLTRRTVRSLAAVSAGIERVARGDFEHEIDVPPGDEIADLAREANLTTARLRHFREQVEREVQRTRTALVETQRQAQVATAANKELEAFSSAVSHDLRAPLRGIDGFSQALVEDEAERLSPKGHDYLQRIRNGAQRMGELIDDLLRLSRVTRADFHKDQIDLSAIVALVVGELRKLHPDRNVDVVVQSKVTAFADARLMRISLENLINNAWKFTVKTAAPRIEFGARTDDELGTVYFVRDNGAGFDMKYADRLFGAFQRLHSEKDFAGTGIGLATVQRIVVRHGGRIWVEAAVNQGATFQFTLPDEPSGR